MRLDELYKEHGVAEQARLDPKPIVFMAPSEDYDITPHLHRFGLAPDEATMTWPKTGDPAFMVEEVKAAKSKAVIQVGGVRVSKRYPVIRTDGVCSVSVPGKIHSVIGDTYVNLHHHDEFSIRDSIGTVGALTKILQKRRQRFCAVTNHGSVGGWIRQYSTCKKAGIKPIFGMEAYANNCRSDDPEVRKQHRSNHHLILLARNETGFYNLIRIHNDAQLDGFYYKPRVNHEAVKRWGEGIIGSSACFTKGQLVDTPNGLVPIEVAVKGRVITHCGNTENIIIPTSRKYTGLLKTITTKGFSFPVVSTDDHEFFVVKKKNQLKEKSVPLPIDFDINKQTRSARRRFFVGEWTSDLEKGDWLLYPVPKSPQSFIDSIETYKYNKAAPVAHLVVVSRAGRTILRLRNAIKQAKVQIADCPWTKCGLYRVEKGCNLVSKTRLDAHLGYLGLDKDDFYRKFCKLASSDSMNVQKHKLSESLKVTPQLAFLFGAYCAEGSSNKYGISFTLHLKEDKFAREIVEDIKSQFGLDASIYKRRANNRQDIQVFSVAVSRLMMDVCGDGAVNKQVPDVVWSMTKEQQAEFVRGLLIGDGSLSVKTKRSNEKITFATVSPLLAHGLVKLLLLRSIVPNASTKEAYVGKDGTNHQKSYWVSICGKQARCVADYVWRGGQLLELPNSDFVRKNVPIRICGTDYYTSEVRSVKRRNVANEDVFCLQVEKDHSFTVGLSSVHNCMSGEIPQLLLEGKKNEAKAVYELYAEALDEFYIELTMIEMKEQVALSRKLVEFAQEVGAPLIVTCDSHYLLPEHAETHDILLLIKSGKTKHDQIANPEEVWQFDARNLYYRDEIAMRNLWRKGFHTQPKTSEEKSEHCVYEDDVFTEAVFNEAVLNTRRIAASIDSVELDSDFKLPKLYDDGPTVLRTKAVEGFKQRRLKGKTYSDRLHFELDMICELGFADYFLAMDRIITDTKAEWGEWAVGYGRGCFHPASRVLMGNGLSKFIGDVEIGDVVVSHDGSLQSVLDTFEYSVDEDLIQIDLEDGRSFQCTADHLIFVHDGDDIVQKPARDLEDGDDIVEV
jgi:hypothetical protein